MTGEILKIVKVAIERGEADALRSIGISTPCADALVAVTEEELDYVCRRNQEVLVRVRFDEGLLLEMLGELGEGATVEQVAEFMERRGCG